MHANPQADRLIREGATLSAAGAPDAQEPLEQAVALAPDDPDILIRAASLSFDNHQFDRARELFLRARDHVTPDFDLMPALASLGGQLALRDGRHAEALQLLQAAFDGWPWRRVFGYQLAVELLRAGRTADACSVVDEALNNSAPDDDDLPRLREHLEKIAEAERRYAERATSEAALTLAYALNVFDRRRARELFETVLRDGDERQRALAAFNLGTLLSADDRAASQRHYEQALAGGDPKISAAAAYNLAGLLVDSDPVQARGMFEQAAQSPDADMVALAREQLAALD